MKPDSALRKVLNQHEAQLPHGFHNRMMEKIHQEAELKNRREYLAGIVFASVVTMVLMGGAAYLLSTYSNFNIRFLIPNLSHYFLASTTVVYSAYLSLIVMVLLALDLFLRQYLTRTEKR